VFNKLIVLVHKFSREKSFFIQTFQKYLISFPEIQIKKFIIIYPLQNSFRGINQLSLEFINDKQPDIPCLDGVESGKCQKCFQFRIFHFQSRLFLYFTNRTFLRRLSFLKFTSETIPFSRVHIVLFFDAMEHQGLIVFTDIAEGGEFHLKYPIIKIPKEYNTESNKSKKCEKEREFHHFLENQKFWQ